MESITGIFGFLLAHPALIAVLAILIVVFIVSLIKKIIKMAVIMFIIMLAAGGAIFHSANNALQSHGKEIIRELKEDIP